MRRTFMLVVAMICVVWPLSVAANNPNEGSYQFATLTNYEHFAYQIDEISRNNIFLNWKAGHEADTLLLTCMDFRLIGAVEKYMEKNHKQGEYDYVVLAGASLGVNNTTYPEWGLGFWEHLTLSRDLHNVKNVMIIDHRNCGAYKALLKLDFPEGSTKAQLADETAAHKKQLDQLASAIHSKYPFLNIQTRLMALDGSVEEIGNVSGVGNLPTWPPVTH